MLSLCRRAETPYLMAKVSDQVTENNPIATEFAFIYTKRKVLKKVPAAQKIRLSSFMSHKIHD